MHLEKVCVEVAGLIPAYANDGDSCLVFCRAGDGQRLCTFTEPRSVEAAKRQLARCYALDLTVQALLLRRDYHRSPPLPFYLYDGRVFVPLKMRLPKVAGDPCYGYLEMSVISRVVPDENGYCQVIFTDGTSLPVYNQINTARLAIYLGIEIQKDIFARHYSRQQEVLQAFRILHGYLKS